jgi:rubrerythrin
MCIQEKDGEIRTMKIPMLFKNAKRHEQMAITEYRIIRRRLKSHGIKSYARKDITEILNDERDHLRRLRRLCPAGLSTCPFQRKCKTCQLKRASKLGR